MPESPDFDMMALGIVDRVEAHIRPDVRLGARDEDPVRETVIRRIAEQLRLVWNARGAADIAKLDIVIQSHFGLSLKAKDMSAAVRSLDR